MRSVLDRAHEFDLIHAHLEWASLMLARVAPVPVVTTMHGRLDLPWATEALTDPPAGLVAISQNQASTHPTVPWTVIHNGLTLDDAPFERRRTDALCFVGRVAPEKGIVEAIAIAQATGRPLKIAAKAGPTTFERDYYEIGVPPGARGGRVGWWSTSASWSRRIATGSSRRATPSLMPGSWPEPFGLVAIEALACGTPVIARRIGALPEIIRDGVDGFFGDDEAQMAFKIAGVDDLDRAAIRASVLERFSAGRMTDGYEALYRRMLGLVDREGVDALHLVSAPGA